MVHDVISSAPRASLVKTARKCVLPVKTVTTATPFMANAHIVTLAGLGTGKKKYTMQPRNVKRNNRFVSIMLFSQPFSQVVLYRFQHLKRNGSDFN